MRRVRAKPGFRKQSFKSQTVKLDKVRLKKWSMRVRGRDRFICYSCGGKKDLHAHHIVSKFRNPDYAYRMSNGITLCSKCHIGEEGVHGRDMPPKNEIVRRLRTIHRMNDKKAIYSMKPSQPKRKRIKISRVKRFYP